MTYKKTHCHQMLSNCSFSRIVSSLFFRFLLYSKKKKKKRFFWNRVYDVLATVFSDVIVFIQQNHRRQNSYRRIHRFLKRHCRIHFFPCLYLFFSPFFSCFIDYFNNRGLLSCVFYNWCKICEL